MKRIDFSLAPSVSEIVEATKAARFPMFHVAGDALAAARNDSVERFPETWGYVRWSLSYAIMAGYILGVRNERTRRKREPAGKRRE